MFWVWRSGLELLTCVLLLAVFLPQFHRMNTISYHIEPWSLSVHFCPYVRVIVQELFNLHLQILCFLQSRSNRIELFFNSSNVRRVGLNIVPNSVKISCHPASQPSASSSQLINLFRLHFDWRWRQTAAKAHLKRTVKSHRGHHVRTPNPTNNVYTIFVSCLRFIRLLYNFSSAKQTQVYSYYDLNRKTLFLRAHAFFLLSLEGGTTIHDNVNVTSGLLLKSNNTTV